MGEVEEGGGGGRGTGQHCLGRLHAHPSPAPTPHTRPPPPPRPGRYEAGQHYDAHYDAFMPDGYGPQASARVATVLFYLTDVGGGGETVFPLEGAAGSGPDEARGVDFKACAGFRVAPRAGDALLFFSQHPNGTFDHRALHGGCPVTAGTKWVATKWLRDAPGEW